VGLQAAAGAAARRAASKAARRAIRLDRARTRC
jgi:hypothetical protein